MDSDSIEDYLSQNSDMDPIDEDSDTIYADELDDSAAIDDSGVSGVKVNRRQSSNSLDRLSDSPDQDVAAITLENRYCILDPSIPDEPSRLIDDSDRSTIPSSTTATDRCITAAAATNSQTEHTSRSEKCLSSSTTLNGVTSTAGVNDKVVNVNSTKIIIKGIAAMTNASNAAAESVADDEVKNAFPQEKSEMQTDFDLPANELTTKVLETDRQQTSTPKIKREIKQLQKMVNESKILTDFINDQDSQRMRKKRLAKTEAEHDYSVTAGDNESIASKSSNRSRSRSLSRNQSPVDTSGGTTASGRDGEKNRRNMRSQNAEFSAKHYKFLRGIHQQDSDVSDPNSDVEVDQVDKVPVNVSFEEKPKSVHPPPKPGWDKFCWSCHQDNCKIPCINCKRCYHSECLKVKQTPKNDSELAAWKCPECIFVEMADLNYKKDSKPKYQLDQLCTMLKFALKRFTQLNGAKTFLFPNDKSHIVNEMNFNIIRIKIDAKAYTTTEAFTSDVKWILHNCIISQYRGTKFLAVAKIILKICKQEMYDIETCPECYFNANIRKSNWFVEVCTRPHILLWAKLKGFPYWPAKAMGVNSAALVDVRFFGDHDRAWVPIRDCYLFSEADPNPATNKFKRHSIADSLKEVEVYVQQITSKFGSFVYAPFKCPYDPYNEDEQLEKMIPGIGGFLKSSHISTNTNKSDLTYKIVKSADNNLSIVKKIESPIKNDNDDAKSSTDKTDTPDDPKSKRSKSIGRTSVSLPPGGTVPRQYHVMRRTSNVRGDDLGKVKVVILKRKSSLPSSVDPNDTIPPKKKLKSQSSPEKQECSSSAEPIAITSALSSSCVEIGENALNSVEKSRKISTPTTNSPVVLLGVMPDANHVLRGDKTVLPEPKTIEDTDVRNDCADQTMANVSTDSETPSINCSGTTTTDQPDLSTLDLPLEVAEAANAANTIGNSETSDPLASPVADNPTSTTATQLWIPMDEVKKEIIVDDDDDGGGGGEGSSNRSSDNATTVTAVPQQQHPNNSPLESDAAAIIKTEPMQVDDSESVSISIRNAPSTKMPTAEKSTAELLITRGNITVKDISKLKNIGGTLLKTQFLNLRTLKKTVFAKSPANTIIDQRARKSFPSGITVSTKRPLHTINVSPSSLNNTSNMVYIPMKDAKQYNNATSILSVAHGGGSRGDIGTPATLKSTPPPLTSVSLGAKPVQSVSQTLQSSHMQTTPTMLNVPPSSMNLLTSCPPPLTLSSSMPLTTFYTMPASLPPVTSVAQPVLTTAAPTIVTVQPPPPQHHDGFVTENLAAAVTDTIARVPPRLVARPSGALRSDGTALLQSSPGSVSSTLADNSHKLADFFRSVIEDTLCDLAAENSLEAKVKLLQLENEKLKFTHNKELNDLKTNTDLILCEMKKSLENARTQLINDTRKQCEQERIRAVDETKKKQWCINCGKEAQFYCCWNTSYCDYPCQQLHWLRHMPNCAQNGDANVDANAKKIGVKVIQMKDKPPMVNPSKTVTPVLAPRIIASNIRVANTKHAVNMQRMIPIVHHPRTSALCYVNRQRSGLVVSSASSSTTSNKTIVSSTFSPAGLVINASPSNTNSQSNAESMRITPD